MKIKKICIIKYRSFKHPYHRNCFHEPFTHCLICDNYTQSVNKYQRVNISQTNAPHQWNNVTKPWYTIAWFSTTPTLKTVIYSIYIFYVKIVAKIYDIVEIYNNIRKYLFAVTKHKNRMLDLTFPNIAYETRLSCLVWQMFCSEIVTSRKVVYYYLVVLSSLLYVTIIIIVRYHHCTLS